MNRIYMNKYGFVREASRDFSDDGNYFEMWKTADGSMYVTKCVNHGFVYICGRADMIPSSGGYRIYSRVEGYKNLDDLNGVSISYLTDEKLQAFHDRCIKFVKDLKDTLAQVVIPTDEEILAKMRELNAPYYKAKEIVKAALGEEDALDFIARIENWEINRFTSNYKRLCGGITREDWVLSHFSGKPEAVEYIERTPANPEDIYYVKEILEIIRRHKPTRFFAEGVDGKGYIYDRKFSLTSPIAVEKDLATAKAQVEKFNAEEE